MFHCACDAVTVSRGKAKMKKAMGLNHQTQPIMVDLEAYIYSQFSEFPQCANNTLGRYIAIY